MTNKEFFIQQWHSEMRCTLIALKGLPKDPEKLNYKPDPLSRSAIEIVNHILPHAAELRAAIRSGQIVEKDQNFTDMEKAAEYHIRESLRLVEALEKVNEETWETMEVSLLTNEGNRLYPASLQYWCWRVLSFIIHHRGQLSTYYRPMGVRHPNIYGPVAEDLEDMIVSRQNLVHN